MVAKLDYQPPKWAKEQKKDLQLLRQSKGKDITLSNLQRILKEEEEFPEMRNYEVPEQYQIAAESEVRTKGRYVYLVISQAAEDAEEIIEEELERP